MVSFWIRCQHIDYRSSIAVMYLYVDLFRLAVYSYNFKHDNNDKRIILKDRCINLKAKHFNLQYNYFAGTCTWTLGYCTWPSLPVDPVVNHRVCVYLFGVSTLIVHWYRALISGNALVKTQLSTWMSTKWWCSREFDLLLLYYTFDLVED